MYIYKGNIHISHAYEEKKTKSRHYICMQNKKLCLFLPVGGFENGTGCFVLSMAGLFLSTHWSECVY